MKSGGIDEEDAEHPLVEPRTAKSVHGQVGEVVRILAVQLVHR